MMWMCGYTGLPGRFVEQLTDPIYEIPPNVVVQLLDDLGIQRGTALRILTCHGASACDDGLVVAQLLADEWTGHVQAPNGLLRLPHSGGYRIDIVDWEQSLWEPDRMEVDPNTIQLGAGSFLTFAPNP